MAYENYERFKIRVDRGVAFATIDHPPINLLDQTMFREINRLGKEIEADEAVQVAVFDSADPDFFIAHADVRDILDFPTEVPPKAEKLGAVHHIFERYRTMPKVSIAKIEGRARGGGSEFALSLDMRFGAIGRAILSQPEVGIGILPGGSGTQRLPRLMGRGRALEIVLGCEDVPAELAERYGYINRALPPEELTPFVERLAYRIASFSAEAVAFAKASVNAAELPIVEGLIEEAHFLNRCAAGDSARKRMRKFLEMGGQTREVELGLGAFVDRLAEPTEER
jgi:enoyl-CoA hydratase/carnithine racemase